MGIYPQSEAPSRMQANHTLEVEYMLDLESGETEGRITVVSTRHKKTADRLSGILKEKGIQAQIFDSAANGYLEQEGIKIMVDKDDFWKAHNTIKENLKEFLK